MKKNFSKNFSEEEWHYFTLLQISLFSGLIEDSWIPLSVSAFNLLQYFWTMNMKKNTVSQIQRWNTEESFNRLLGHLWIFFFDTTVLTSGNFLKVSCSVESEIILVNFFLYPVTLKYISISYFECIFYQLWCQALVILKTFIHWVKQIFQMLTFHYIILKIIFVDISTNFTRKVLKYWESVKLVVEDTSFINIHFPLKAQLIIGNKYCQLFSLK